MSEPDNGTQTPEILSNEEFVRAIAQMIVERLDGLNSHANQEWETISNTTYPRYSKLVSTRKFIGFLSVVLLLYATSNTFHQILPVWHSLRIGLIASIVGILSGLTLIVVLVFEVFLGAGIDIELKLQKGQKILQEYQFIPSLNKLPFLLTFLGLGFFTIILGFASFDAELLRQNSNNFSGLEEGFLSIYFSIVTFSTVGYGDIYPTSIIARSAAICEIFIAMFFSLIALSTTLSWVTAYERQQHDLSIKQRIQDIEARKTSL
ncbi:potassium channel family protein [Lusitaniella coriacea]|nr:potassium channel family protein [Lusitaniella coriacea]